jgi:glyoxylase-like metal-dependent hydrolase (beta-lactamase superfamily II)/rhodanese-related sulfurtransferase
MKIERFYLSCLSHVSYILYDKGEAVIVDPKRDIEDYLHYLDEKKLRLKYILETHLHADFVSGHLELKERTGAKILISSLAKAEFDHIGVKEGNIFYIGETVVITVLETPGHTPEGVCFLIKNLNTEDPFVLFTGDTLFAGDVGRPDLLEDTYSPEELASLLYDSLYNKILKLPETTKIFPSHGAGSSCGRELQDVEFTTIREQKLINYALQSMNREQFIYEVTIDQPPRPEYFLHSGIANREGARQVQEVLKDFRPLTLKEFQTYITNEDIVVIDVRDTLEFVKEYIPNSYFIGLEGSYAGWLGTLINREKKIIFVAEPGAEEEAAIRATRVGYDSVIGYLEGGINTWKKAELPTKKLKRYNVNQFNEILKTTKKVTIVDVRKNTEYQEQSIPTATNIPLNELENNLDKLNPLNTIIVHCRGGYRSVIAGSILQKNGFSDIHDLEGGINAWLDK